MSSSSEERFDPLLLSVANHVHGIDELLDVFLGFMRRKSDAFNPPGGYPQLEAAFVASLKRQYEIGQAAAKAKAAAAAPARRDAPKPSAKPAVPAPTPVDDVLELSPDGFDVSTAPASTTTSASAAPAAKDVVAPGAAPPSAAQPLSRADRATSDVESAPAASEKPPLGNGGTTDRYSWTQTLGDVTVVFNVPTSTRSRDVTADISTKRVKVALRGASAPLLDGALPKRIKAEDSYWTLDESSSGKTLTLYITKEAGMEWWASVAEGEPAIDITKIQPENSKLSELDADTRTTVEKMMFDQRQKSMGLPTSDELKKQEVLANFIRQHPEMDFSGAKFQ